MKHHSTTLRRAACICLAGVAGMLAASCASSTGASQPSSSSTDTTTTVTSVARQYVTIDGRRILVPTERGSRPIQADQDDGEQILIEKQAIVPLLLFATEGYTVTWTNLTDVPQQVEFTNSAPRFSSPVIPPGGHWSYKPSHAMNFTFQTATGLHGQFYSAPDTPSVP